MPGDAQPPATGNHGERAATISREMVKLMRNVSGRGPTRARTTIARDHVLVMFRETLSEGERNLAASGHEDVVHATRSGYQELLRDDAIAMLERVLGRSVLGFMSTNHLDPDRAAELFVLEPADDSEPHVVQEAEAQEADEAPL